MNECQRIHETVVRDIMDVIDGAKDVASIVKGKDFKPNANIGSIAKRASNLILVFPVLVSSSLSYNTATMISKAIERKCVTLLQILFSAAQITSSQNLFDYIHQFHTNLDPNNISVDDFMSAMTKMTNEGVIDIDRDMLESIREDMQNIDFVMENDFSEHSLNDFSYQSNMYGESAIVLSEADGKNENPYTPNSIKFPTAKNMQQVNDTGKWLDQKNTFFRNQLTQADVIKANEITPTTMIVNFISRQGGGNSIAASGVIGVKAKLYPVDSMDICNRCVTKYKDKQGLFNFIRFSTREISFFHDFLFAIDRAKIRAINMADKSNNGRMFNILERRADKNRFMSKLGKNDASAIASLVISQEEVEYMKKYFRFNLEQGASSKAVLEGYNLLNLVLVDESIEVAKFMADDGSGMFETVSFDALHRETRDGMKANTVMNILSKIQR
jgi:hypothetical protein